MLADCEPSASGSGPAGRWLRGSRHRRSDISGLGRGRCLSVRDQCGRRVGASAIAAPQASATRRQPSLAAAADRTSGERSREEPLGAALSDDGGSGGAILNWSIAGRRSIALTRGATSATGVAGVQLRVVRFGRSSRLDRRRRLIGEAAPPADVIQRNEPKVLGDVLRREGFSRNQTSSSFSTGGQRGARRRSGQFCVRCGRDRAATAVPFQCAHHPPVDLTPSNPPGQRARPSAPALAARVWPRDARRAC